MGLLPDGKPQTEDVKRFYFSAKKLIESIKSLLN